MTSPIKKIRRRIIMNYTINVENKEKREYEFVIKPKEGEKTDNYFLINGKAVDKQCGIIDKKGRIMCRLDTLKKEQELGVVKNIEEHSHGIMPYYGGKVRQSKVLINEILQMQMKCQKTDFVSLFHGGMSLEMGVSQYRECLGFEKLYANDGDRGTYLVVYCIQNERDRFIESVNRRMESTNEKETMSERYTRVLREAAEYINEHRRDNICCIDKAEYGAAAFICTSLSRDNMTTGKAVFKENNKMCLNRLDTIRKKLDNRFEREHELLKQFRLYNYYLDDNNIYELVKQAKGNELFFLDPPYTKGYEGYAMALNQKNFMNNVSILVNKGCSIIICGYDNELYQKELVLRMDFEKKRLQKLQNSFGNIHDEYIWIYQGR